MSSIELIKSFVDREFQDYILIPSLVNANEYNLLHILFVDIGKQSWKEYLSKVVSGRKKAELFNIGPLSDKTPKQGILNVEELIKKAEVMKICKYDPTYCSTKANLELGVHINPGINAPFYDEEMSSSASHGQSTHSEAMLNLGLITKKRLSYEQIAEMLKKLKCFTEDFIKLARKYHLFIIYEVLYAEKLEVLQSTSSSSKSTADVGIGVTTNSRKPLSDENKNIQNENTLASGINGGSFSRGEENQNMAALSRPKELGPFPIAYKCGYLRLICHKGGKKSLKLTNMAKFYKPFDATDSHFHIPTCNEPSLEASQ